VLVKIVTFFLVGMVVLAMFGRLRVPGIGKISPKVLGRGRCKSCGAPLVGKTPCPCDTRGKKG
jgi:hypothetical protein